MTRRIRVNGRLYEAVGVRRPLREAADTYLYGCAFHLEYPVRDLDDAQDYLDDDFTLMLDIFNDAIKAGDNPLVSWRWYLEDEGSGYFVYESSRELTKKELADLAEETEGQASDGLGEGFEQQDFASYNPNEDEDGEGYGWDEEVDDDDWVEASFNWSDGYKLKELSSSFRRHLR